MGAIGVVTTAAALFSVGHDVGFPGAADTLGALVRIAPKLAVRARRHDSAVLDRLVSEARSRVPQDTGRLLNGIEGRDDGETFEFRASARRDGEEDYAPFVEYGTRGGARGQMMTAHEALDGHVLAARKSRRTHPGTPAQPFFWPAVDSIIGDYRTALDAMADEAAADEGF